jgi:hypothetical protein
MSGVKACMASVHVTCRAKAARWAIDVRKNTDAIDIRKNTDGLNETAYDIGTATSRCTKDKAVAPSSL